MDEEQVGVNEQEVAEPVEQVETEQQQPETEEAQPQEVAAPAQSREDNAKFAQYRRESDQARQERDSAIAELYGQSHGITTWDQYQLAKAQAEQEQRAQQMNVDPKFFNEFENMKQELNQTKAERQMIAHEKTLMEQDKSLAADPKVGEFYTKYKSDVQRLATQANCDYDIALTMLLRDKLPDLLNSTKSSAEQDAVKRLLNNGQSSPGSLSEGGSGQSSTISSMSKADFAKMQEQVLRGERKQI